MAIAAHGCKPMLGSWSLPCYRIGPTSRVRLRRWSGWSPATVTHGLRRDLSEPHSLSEPRIPVAAQELNAGDVGSAFGEGLAADADEEARDARQGRLNEDAPNPSCVRTPLAMGRRLTQERGDSAFLAGRTP